MKERKNNESPDELIAYREKIYNISDLLKEIAKSEELNKEDVRNELIKCILPLIVSSSENTSSDLRNYSKSNSSATRVIKVMIFLIKYMAYPTALLLIKEAVSKHLEARLEDSEEP